jgi:hypothetical protein
MARRILTVLGVGVAALCVAFGMRPDPEARAQPQQEGCSVIFNFTGRAIDFVVPDGIEQVELTSTAPRATTPRAIRSPRTTSARAGSAPECRTRRSP